LERKYVNSFAYLFRHREVERKEFFMFPRGRPRTMIIVLNNKYDILYYLNSFNAYIFKLSLSYIIMFNINGGLKFAREKVNLGIFCRACRKLFVTKKQSLVMQ
jgi:hypothetical protein